MLLTKTGTDAPSSGDPPSSVDLPPSGDSLESVRGRDRSFDLLCAANRESVLRYVKWLTGGAHAAEDIVQLVLLRAWRGFHTLVDERAAQGWLKTIARREVARAFSRQQLDTVDLDNLSPADHLLASRAEGLELEDLQALLESMRHRDRSIILQTMYGYSAEEIAGAERCPAGQVRTRLCRARSRLRALMLD